MLIRNYFGKVERMDRLDCRPSTTGSSNRVRDVSERVTPRGRATVWPTRVDQYHNGDRTAAADLITWRGMTTAEVSSVGRDVQ